MFLILDCFLNEKDLEKVVDNRSGTDNKDTTPSDVPSNDLHVETLTVEEATDDATNPPKDDNTEELDNEEAEDVSVLVLLSPEFETVTSAPTKSIDKYDDKAEDKTTCTEQGVHSDAEFHVLTHKSVENKSIETNPPGGDKILQINFHFPLLGNRSYYLYYLLSILHTIYCIGR